jgi:DNA-binding CsgD family transcriptional regulator
MLAQLPPGQPGELPTAIAVVAMQAQANAAAPEPLRPARLRLRLPSGWLLVHADALKDAGVSAGRVAVVLEPADRAALVPLLLALHGLTGREREVAELIVGGLGTDEIAQRLHISKHTLRDHIKSIFSKVGVTSRPELTAALAQEPVAA